MNEEYNEYLTSVKWADKRELRLELSRGRCEYCGYQTCVQVHHLTYERIFHEDMEDLMCLCKHHHEILEALINRGKIARKGDTKRLRDASLKALRQDEIDRENEEYEKKRKKREERRNQRNRKKKNRIKRQLKELRRKEAFFVKHGKMPEKNSEPQKPNQPNLLYGYNTAKG